MYYELYATNYNNCCLVTNYTVRGTYVLGLFEGYL